MIENNAVPPTMTVQERLYLVDAHAYLHRAYHALPPLRTSKGEPVGAIYGFARMLLLLIKREKPEFLAVCFDSPGPTFRHKACKDYKATRKPTDEDLKVQLAWARELVSALGIAVVEASGYEADDLMATLTRKAMDSDLRVVLVSGDKDALQLVGDRVAVLNEAQGTLFDATKVEEKFKVGPGQLVDYLALTGDSSDNVRGVPGIGAKGAAKLLKRFGSLEELLKAARAGHPDLPPKMARALVASEDVVRLGKNLITLEKDAPVQVIPRACRVLRPAGDRLIGLLRRFEFHSLLRELVPEALAQQSPNGAATASDAPRALNFKPMEPRAFLDKAQGTQEFSLAVHTPPRMAALGLPQGEVAVFNDAELKVNRAALSGRLASGAALKVGHDLKTASAILEDAGLKIFPPKFDTMLAAYCLNPSRATYDLADMFQEYAGAALPEPSPAQEAAAVWALRDRLESELLKDKQIGELYWNIELPLLEMLVEMERLGFALDRPYLLRLGAEFADRTSELKREMDAVAGIEINLNSPKQIAKLLFEDLKLPVVHKTKKGGISTDEEALRALAGLHPLPAKLMEYRELAKLKSTYIDSLLDKMDAQGRVHTHFNQTGTMTGRLSSTEPNLQNIPIRTPLGQKIRRAFIASEGNVLLAADYSQIDLRVMAHLSGDPVLCGAFQKGEDIHRKTACEMFGVPPDKVDKEMRRRAKAVNFGIVYGQGARGLSMALGIGLSEAKGCILRYFARYRGVDEWIKRNLESARREGHVRTLLGRIRYLPDIHARNFATRSSTERVAGNAPIQGTSADIIKVAMVNIHRKMAAETKWKARLILQVHDELIFELPKAETSAFGDWVRHEMENALTLSVPLSVDVKTGPNWKDMEDLH